MTSLREEITKFVIKKQKMIEEELMDALACTPLEDWRFVSIEHYRDDKKMIDIEIYNFKNKPFLHVKARMGIDGNLKFEIGRIEDASIITA